MFKYQTPGQGVIPHIQVQALPNNTLEIQQFYEVTADNVQTNDGQKLAVGQTMGRPPQQSTTIQKTIDTQNNETYIVGVMQVNKTKLFD